MAGRTTERQLSPRGVSRRRLITVLSSSVVAGTAGLAAFSNREGAAASAAGEILPCTPDPHCPQDPVKPRKKKVGGGRLYLDTDTCCCPTTTVLKAGFRTLTAGSKEAKHLQPLIDALNDKNNVLLEYGFIAFGLKKDHVAALQGQLDTLLKLEK